MKWGDSAPDGGAQASEGPKRFENALPGSHRAVYFVPIVFCGFQMWGSETISTSQHNGPGPDSTVMWF